jgi:hypothetical protein
METCSHGPKSTGKVDTHVIKTDQGHMKLKFEKQRNENTQRRKNETSETGYLTKQLSETHLIVGKK